VFYVPLPRGGGGAPQPAPKKPEAPEPAKKKAAPEKPKIQKPPKEEPRKGLPAVDAKKGRPKKAPEKPAAAADSATPGLDFGPVGPGVPDGADTSGDWYLAGVQRRVWTIWMAQVRLKTAQPAVVLFTIQSDGSVTGVQLVQSCGLSAVDFAAQRAIRSAAPFSPLPKHYGTNQLTIQAVFKPAQ
jgi:protein TonB